MHAFVSGATGFIGGKLLASLVNSGINVRVLVRPAATHTKACSWPSTQVNVVSGDLTEPASLHNILDGIDCLFHLAGYAHAEDANSDAAGSLHRRVTVEGTRALVAEAKRAGVKHFIFVSSVKAMGEGSDSLLDEAAAAQPTTQYGRAKLEAEHLVLEAGATSAMHAVVLRLPLVYGPGSKGNILKMIAAIDRRRFPPLPKIDNRRSLVHVDDVVQALRLAQDNSAARGKTYIVSDGHAYSTSQIYTVICAALGRPVPRWSVPMAVLQAAATLGDVVGKLQGRRFVFDSEALGKLTGSAYYSCRKIEHELGFRPTRRLEEGLREMVKIYQQGVTS